MDRNAGKTVREILEGKQGAILRASLPPGSPEWDEIMDLPWEEIVLRARRRLIGYATIRKLLSDKRFDR